MTDAPSVQIHPQALVETSDVGAGTRVWAFAHVCEGAKVGRNCNIGDHAYVERGVIIGDNVIVKNRALLFEGVTVEDDAFIGPAVVFTNDKYPRSRFLKEAAHRYESADRWLLRTHVGRGASIGAGSVILCGLSIGAFAMIGAGSVLAENAEPHGLYFGQPAIRLGYMCACGQRLSKALVCSECGRQYSFDSDGVLQEDTQTPEDTRT
jgi:UDP-2-acetamido-3-amino-2,3-dideoxy-glucuronate N-acetyltransferase